MLLLSKASSKNVYAFPKNGKRSVDESVSEKITNIIKKSFQNVNILLYIIVGLNQSVQNSFLGELF